MKKAAAISFVARRLPPWLWKHLGIRARSRVDKLVDELTW